MKGYVDNSFEGKNKKNPWWIFFHCMKKVHGDETKNARNRIHPLCNVCAQEVAISKNESAMMLSRHFQRKHRRIYEKCIENGYGRFNESPKTEVQATQERKQSTRQISINGYVDKYAREKAELECVRLTTIAVIDCNLPWNIVEKPSFRIMCRAYALHGKHSPLRLEHEHLVDSVTTISSAATVRRISQNRVQDYTISLKLHVREANLRLMRGNVVWGTDDHWTSPDGESITGKSFQWVDHKSTKLCVADMDFAARTTASDGETLAREYVSKLTGEDWRMEVGRDIFVVPEGKCP